jgi:hypothetical protein
MSRTYNYEYFSGANVLVKVNDSEYPSASSEIECAGISFSVSNSQQPVYGYSSTLYDVMLPGRTIVQGTLVINYKEPNGLEKVLTTDSNGNDLAISIGSYVFPLFDIKIDFGDNSNKSKIIKHCALISSGQTVQASEDVILEEYGFLGRQVVPFQ